MDINCTQCIFQGLGVNCYSEIVLKVHALIRTEYTFCQIQHRSPRGALAVCSVCVLERTRCSYTALDLYMQKQ